MKYLIITDIHGSLPAMEKLVKKFTENRCDKFICLGDVLYHGPRNDLPQGYNPKEVAKIIDHYHDRFIWIRGNCDAEVDEMVLKLKSYKRISKIINGRKIIFVHGHHLPESETLEDSNVVIYGHYHVFKMNCEQGVYYINIGSPSIPKDGIPQYGILDDEKIEIRTMDDKKLGVYIL